MTVQRIKHIDEKLQAWAEWRISGSSGYRSPSYSGVKVSYTADSVNSHITVGLEQEALALVIDQAVAALPKDLSKTVIAFYTWEGGMSVVSKKLCLTRATVHRRLCHADIRIDDWLLTRKAMNEKKISKSSKHNFASYTN